MTAVATVGHTLMWVHTIALRWRWERWEIPILKEICMHNTKAKRQLSKRQIHLYS